MKNLDQKNKNKLDKPKLVSHLAKNIIYNLQNELHISYEISLGVGSYIELKI